MNNELAKMATDRGMYYIDTHEPLADNADFLNPEYAGGDGLHMRSGDAYRVGGISGPPHGKQPHLAQFQTTNEGFAAEMDAIFQPACRAAGLKPELYREQGPPRAYARGGLSEDRRVPCRSQKQKKRVCRPCVCGSAGSGPFVPAGGPALTAPRTIRLEDYAEPVPEAFRMKADITQKDGMLSVDGYACIEGERFEHIDTFVALYPGTGGTALRLPTKMVLSEEAYVAGGSLAMASWAGLLRAFGNRRCQQGKHCLPHRRA